MKHKTVGAILLALPVIALAAPQKSTVMTLQPDPSAAPVPAGPGDAIVVALVAGYGTKPQPATIAWRRYDPMTGRINLFPAKGETDHGAFMLRFEPTIKADRETEYTVFMGLLPAGDYALVADVRGLLRFTTFCEGAPVMHVTPSSVTYLGSYRVYADVHVEGSKQNHALGWEGDLSKAKQALAKLPDMASRLVAADIHNGATFDCPPSQSRNTAYIIPGMPNIAGTPPSARSEGGRE